MDSYEVISDFFEQAGEPVQAGKVVAATGIERKEVDKIMKKLKKEEKIVSPKRCYWEWKE